MRQQAIKLLIIEEGSDNWSDFEKGSLQSEYPLNISVVSTLEKARIIIRNDAFQAVLCDYQLNDGICIDMLPDLNGIPLIVMIKEGNEEATLLALKSGVAEYLIKDDSKNYRKFLSLAISKSIRQKTQADELQKYRTQLENIVEERTIELIDMYSKLQESETNFRNIFNSTTEGIIITDFSNNFIEANEAVIEQLGFTREYLASNDLMNFVAAEDKKRVLEHVERVKKGLPSGNMELDVILPGKGSFMSYEISSVPIIFNQKNAILSIMRDIRERKNHAIRLFETIIQTEEDERKRIARDLHDEIGPLISALKIFTTTFIETKDIEKKNKLAEQIRTIVREVIDSIKIISNDMSPHVLVNFGLHAAIQNFIDLFSRNIHISLSANIEGIRFPLTVESSFYRIIKELINNTIKHAAATGIEMILDYSQGTLKCYYRDDGIGFDWHQQMEVPGKGMGINNIITRIRSMGGDFEVSGETEKGFEIKFGLQTVTKDGSGKKEI